MSWSNQQTYFSNGNGGGYTHRSSSFGGDGYVNRSFSMPWNGPTGSTWVGQSQPSGNGNYPGYYSYTTTGPMMASGWGPGYTRGSYPNGYYYGANYPGGGHYGGSYSYANNGVTTTGSYSASSSSYANLHGTPYTQNAGNDLTRTKNMSGSLPNNNKLPRDLDAEVEVKRGPPK